MYCIVFSFVYFLFPGGVLGIFCVYPLEFVGTKWRVFITMMSIFALGHMTMALIAMYVRDWRRLSFIIGVIPIPFVVLIAL